MNPWLYRIRASQQIYDNNLDTKGLSGALMSAFQRGGLASFATYVTGRYTPAKDLWKVILHNDGKKDVTIVDDQGRQIGFKKYTGGSETGLIAKTLGISTTNTLMGPGAGYTYNNATGKFDLAHGYSGVVHFTPQQAAEIAKLYGNTQSGPTATDRGSLDGFLNTVGSIWNGVMSVEASATENLLCSEDH